MLTRTEVRDVLQHAWDWLLWRVLPRPWYYKLPDRCEVPGCSRRGVRGNENIVDGVVMCDNCSIRRLRGL